MDERMQAMESIRIDVPSFLIDFAINLDRRPPFKNKDETVNKRYHRFLYTDEYYVATKRWSFLFNAESNSKISSKFFLASLRQMADQHLQ